MPFSLSTPPTQLLVLQLEQAARHKSVAMELADDLATLRTAVLTAIASGKPDDLQIALDYLAGIHGVITGLPDPRS